MFFIIIECIQIRSWTALYLNNIGKRMEIYYTIKSSWVRDRRLSTFLLLVHEVQFVALMLLPISETFLASICKLVLLFVNEQGQYSPVIVYTNSAFNLLLVLCLVLQMCIKKINWFKQIVLDFICLTLTWFKYILLVPVLSMNAAVFAGTDDLMEIAMTLVNLGMAVGVVSIEGLINQSYHFKEKDFCSRRESLHSVLFLMCGVVISKEILGTSIALVILLLLCAVRASHIVRFVDYKLIQKIELFFSFFNFYLIFIVYPHLQQKAQFNLLALLCQFSLGIPACYYATYQCLKKINYDHFNFQNVFKYKIASEVQGDESNEKRIKKDLNSIYSLCKVAMSRQNYSEKDKVVDQQANVWWSYYNRILLEHLSWCSLVECPCHSKQEGWQKLVILNEMQTLIKGFISENKKENRFNFYSIYFHLELSDKPLKAYLDIMRMRKKTNGLLTEVELNCVTEQARKEFDKIFFIHKIENNSIPILKIVDFEVNLEKVEAEICKTAGMMMEFYEIFEQREAKIEEILEMEEKIKDVKKTINNNLEILVREFPNDAKVNVLTFVFFRFFEMYRSREKEFAFLSREKDIRNRLFSKDEPKYFKAEYGVIYIDMIEDRGKIKKITKSVCESFGYKVGEMIELNIKKFMPHQFAKHHHKFLNNFIEKGEIKALKIKKRILFAKHSNKLIFPIEVRFKTEHLFEKEFGISCLIKQIKTKSGFIILNKNGRIQEISQQIYNKVFQKARLDIQIIKNTSILHILPDIVKIITNEEYLRQPQFRSDIIFTYSKKYAEERFKNFKQDKSKTGDMSKNSEFMGSYEYCQTSQGNQTEKGRSFLKCQFNLEYCAEAYKKFSFRLDFSKLFSMPVTYKVEKIVTTEFELFLIEIISFGDEERDKKKISSQYNNYGQFLGVQDPESSFLIAGPEDQNQDGESKKKMMMMSKNKNFKPIQNSLKLGQQLNESGSKTLILIDNDEMAEKKILMDNNSQSSIGEGNFQKQIIESAFNLDKSSKIQKKLGMLIGIIVLLFILLAGLTLQTITGINVMQDISLSQEFAIKIYESFQYHFSLNQIEKFYEKRLEQGYELPEGAMERLREKKVEISQTYSTLIKDMDNYNKLVDYSDRSLQYIDPLNNQIGNVSLLYLFLHLEYLFKNEGDPITELDFELNFVIITERLRSIRKQNREDYEDILNHSVWIQSILYGLYEITVVTIVIFSCCLLKSFRNKQKRILNFLSSVSKRETRKASRWMEVIRDNFSLEKQSSITLVVEQIKFEEGPQFKHEERVEKQLNIVFGRGKNKNNMLLYPCLLLFAFVVFSLYSTLMFQSYFEAEENKEANMEMVAKLAKEEAKSPIFVNIYLVNINKIMNNQPLLEIDPQFYEEVNSDFFSLVKLVSEAQHSQNQKKQRSGITMKLCDLVDCHKEKQENDQTLVYQVLEFRQKFGYLQDLNYGKNLTQKLIDEWALQNNIEFTLAWIPTLHEFTKVWNEQLSQFLMEILQAREAKFYIISFFFIPMYIITLVIGLKKFIVFLNTMIMKAEAVFMMFPISAISDNAYLMNYFKNQIKQNK